MGELGTILGVVGTRKLRDIFAGCAEIGPPPLPSSWQGEGGRYTFKETVRRRRNPGDDLNG
jgi:hypothetical protein